MWGRISGWLIDMIGPIAARALLALGFGAISFVSVTAISNGLIAIAQNSWSQIPTTVLQLATLSGVPQALGMMFGAWVARVSLWAANNGTKYVLKK